ncbi:MAG: AlkZ family DNA glycosylase [Ardenticatenaceae bacterium]|nr:AlkZ family DNA glycosylase [Ardenticatenaceae bacterium]
MKLSNIAQLRLRCQHLASAPLNEPVDVVRWLTAVQAQDYYGAKWALGLRLPNAVEADLDAAYNAGAILRTHVLRPTWHFVAPEDIRWLLQLTGPRVHAKNGTAYRQTELDEKTRHRCYEVLAKALQNGRYLTRHELGEALQKAGIKNAESGRRLTYIVMSAELDGILCNGPRRGNQFTYALLEEWVSPAPERTHDEALAELTRRFFLSHGPATEYDFANWSGLTLADGRTGLDIVQKELEQAEIDGQTYWFSPEIPTEVKRPSRAYILSVFDEYFIGYKDRRAIMNAEADALLGNLGNALTYILVLDGQVIGTCRRTLQKDTATIEVDSLRPLTSDDQEVITAAAQRYGRFFGREAVIVWR